VFAFRVRRRSCRQIKKRSSTLPIIILSASTNDVDKVVFLELGADHYVSKPFSPRELLACVRAVIRSTRRPLIRDQAEFGGIFVDFTRMGAAREGQAIALTAQEFKILEFFVHNEERIILRDELLKEVLGHEDYSSTRTVDNHILRLRQKLGRDPTNPDHFLTEYGAGYRFVCYRAKWEPSSV
jgi:two-component system alkaline phosphatase synthesis response regulator PhoP